jgi:hypothetical protein
MSLAGPRSMRTPSIVIVGLAVIAAVWLGSGRGRVVGLSQTVRIDDFCFSGLTYRGAIGPDPASDLAVRSEGGLSRHKNANRSAIS